MRYNISKIFICKEVERYTLLLDIVGCERKKRRIAISSNELIYDLWTWKLWLLPWFKAIWKKSHVISLGWRTWLYCVRKLYTKYRGVGDYDLSNASSLMPRLICFNYNCDDSCDSV